MCLPKIAILARVAAIIRGELIRLPIHLRNLIRPRFALMAAIRGIASNTRC